MAAAYAALLSLYENIPLISNHPRHSFSFEEKQLCSLHQSVCFLIKFMERSDNSHGATKEAAEALESRIARAVLAAEDVIESHVVDQIHGGSTLGRNRRFRFLLDLEKAIQDVDFICMKALNVQKSQSGFKVEQPITSAAATASSASLASFSEKIGMVGFDGELLRLLQRLTGASSSRRVIPIVGMGGIGKTTLATNVFQHKLIVARFDVRLWVTLSQEFSVHKILTELVASLHSQIKKATCCLSETSSGKSSVAELGQVLRKNLYGRRYLIVLDNMWSVQVWDEIKFFFPDKINESFIVVTTRQSDVSRHLGSWCIHVPLLDKDSSWYLFCKKTFEDHSCPPQLEDIGKKIVEKCGGLPLPIVVVGGHLKKSSRTIEYWESIANDMSPVLNYRETEQCLNILSFSYKHLPIQLKPCFLFLGVFWEDQEIPVLELLSLWIAEGFIPKHENYTSEDIAFSYLHDLFERNLVSLDGRVCRIHDLLRELCLKIAKKEEFFSVLDTRKAINGERRVVIRGKIPKMNHQAKLFVAPRSAPHIRSLICEGGQLSSDMKLLRILNEVDSNKINSQQVNLRYLKADLYTCYLPSSISLFWNLQTLIINGAFGPIIAPYEIWEMLQLKHIEVCPLHLPHPLPLPLPLQNVFILKNLHTLCNATNIMLGEEVCRRIPNIEKLEVSYCAEPNSYYGLQYLGCFEQLNSLDCYFNRNAKWHDIASSLTFPNSLRRLSLRFCSLSWKELTKKIGSLPHLEILHVCAARNQEDYSEWTSAEGEGVLFPSLRKLSICHPYLIHWDADEFHFPVLEQVGLCTPKLEEFPPRIGEIPTLRQISMGGCSMSSYISAMRMMVEQNEQGNENFELHITLMDDEKVLEECKQIVEEEDLTCNNIHLHLRKD